MKTLPLILLSIATILADNFFKSAYKPGIQYSPNWYGVLNVAPSAKVLLYNDSEGFCVGYMASPLPAGVTALTWAQANTIIQGADSTRPRIWKGGRLEHRWDIDTGVAQ